MSSLARILKREVRKSDLVARFGGEEFVVLLPETSLKKAGELADRICKNVESENIVVDEDVVIQLTVSIGVSSYPYHGKNWSEILGKADASMYEAKNSGRNKVVLAE